MISKDDMMAVMLDACPSFAPTWQAFLDDWRDEPVELPLYGALADLARHLIGLVERGEGEELPAVFRTVERWCVEGDAYVREAASVGLLEDLQNLNLHAPMTAPAQLRAMLGPESLRRWDEVAEGWELVFQWRESQQQRYDPNGNLLG